LTKKLKNEEEKRVQRLRLRQKGSGTLEKPYPHEKPRKKGRTRKQRKGEEHKDAEI